MGKNSVGRKIAFIGFGNLGVQISSYLIEAGYDESEFIYFDDIAFSINKIQKPDILTTFSRSKLTTSELVL